MPLFRLIPAFLLLWCPFAYTEENGQISPDGKHVLFEDKIDAIWSFDSSSHTDHKVGAICVSDTDGSNKRRLTANQQNWGRQPLWSSDDTIMFVSSGGTKTHQVYSMKSDGSNVTQITQAKRGVHGIAPGLGKEILYAENRERVGLTPMVDLFLLNTDTHKTRPVIQNACLYSYAMSPDHKMIAIGGPGKVTFVPIDGQGFGPTKVVKIDHHEGLSPRWSADSRTVQFTFSEGPVQTIAGVPHHPKPSANYLIGVDGEVVGVPPDPLTPRRPSPF